MPRRPVARRLLARPLVVLAVGAGLLPVGGQAALAASDQPAGRPAPQVATSSAMSSAAPGGVRVVVTLDDRVADVVTAARAAAPSGGRVTRTWSTVLKGFAITVPAAALPALERAPGVRRVEPDVVVTASAVQPSPPRGLDRIDQAALPLSTTYESQRTGAGVTAYVLDTGIRVTHTDFGGRARAGVDTINPGGTADDCEGHGTHVAGTVGGTQYGVAKAVSLVAVRVLDCEGSGSLSTLVEGLDWVAQDHQAGQPATAVLSLGGPASSTLDEAVRRVVADGVFVVVAAGNESADACLSSPARVPEASTVGASDPATDQRAKFSNRGRCLDIFAPGVEILSAGNADDTASVIGSGTSMAAPHVAGAAALVLEGIPTASPSTVDRLIKDAATQDVVKDARSATDELLRTDPTALAGPRPVSELAGRYTPLSPARLLDTREQTGGRLEPRQPRELRVTGRGGVPATGVTAVALNVTVTGPLQDGHLVVYPAGRATPLVSNLNHGTGQTVANLVVTGVSPTGQVAIMSNAGRPDVIVDVAGYYSDTLGGSRSTALSPERLLDTRVSGASGGLPSGLSMSVPVTGRAGVPTEDVSAVVVNVTVVDPQAAGHLTVFPSGMTAPTASTLNYTAGATVPNLAVVGVGPDGSISLQASNGAPYAIVDVVGWYGTGAESRFVQVGPERVLDSRESGGRFGGSETRSVAFAGRAGIPSTGVTGVVVNLTAVSPLGPGHLTAFPADQARPVASNVNYAARQTVPNLALSGTSIDGAAGVKVFSSTGGPDVLVDVVGYTTSSP